MKNIKKLMLAVAAVLTLSATAGAQTVTWNSATWADQSTGTRISSVTYGDITISANSNTSGMQRYSNDDLWFPGALRIYGYGTTVTFSSAAGNFRRIELTGQDNAPEINAGDGWTVDNTNNTAVWEGDAPSVTVECTTYVSQIVFTVAPPLMTLNATRDTATMAMPANDMTVSYALARDLEQAVAFGGIPTEPLTVKYNGESYQFATTPTITLIDSLNNNANIVDDDGLFVYAQMKGDNSSWSDGITLENITAIVQPGTWRLAAVGDSDGDYDGTVYSPEFTLEEKYALVVKPADDFSIGKLVSVTVGDSSLTIDANGKAYYANMNPNTQVQFKAMRGYVIDSVAAKRLKPVALAEATVGMRIGSDGKAYGEDVPLPTGVTAVALVIYKSETTGSSLALALSDEDPTSWSTAKSRCENKTAIDGGTWSMPTQAQWNTMITAAGGANNLCTCFSSVGGANLQRTTSAYNGYWSSTNKDDNGSKYLYNFYTYNWSFDKDEDHLARAVLSF